MRVKLKGINTVRARLADGTVKVYYYAWKGGPPLEGKPGTPEFVNSFMEAAKQRVTTPKNTLSYVLQEYQKSDAFADLAPSSRKNFIRIIRVIEADFGDLPLPALKAKGIRLKFKEWRKKIAERSPSYADMHWMVLARILSWAVEETLIDVNPCTRGGKLYSGTRRDKIWSDEQIAFVLTNAAEHLRLPFLIALWTGQREADIVDLPWSAYDGRYIRLEQKKGRRKGRPGPRVIIPVAAPLKAVLDKTERRALKMVLDSNGRPWNAAASFSEAFRREKIRLGKLMPGIESLTFHDLRGTAVTRLAVAGCTVPEIASLTGHSMSDVNRILEAHYLNLDVSLAENAIQKLEARTNLPNGLPNGTPAKRKIVVISKR